MRCKNYPYFSEERFIVGRVESQGPDISSFILDPRVYDRQKHLAAGQVYSRSLNLDYFRFGVWFWGAKTSLRKHQVEEVHRKFAVRMRTQQPVLFLDLS